tara:strand:- start:4823 stop:6100 length:1278 start_codon:yes stop_codon:yes gene_type:complete
MKSVLIVSYYWPPLAGSGVQRWLKFAKYLPQNNWKPIIYTPANPYIEIKDEKLLKDISEETEIWKTPIWEPYHIKDYLLGKSSNTQSSGVVSSKRSVKNGLLNWLRGNLFIPDPKLYWIRPSVEYLRNKIKENNIEHIITTGPPHSMHLIGLYLKEITPNLKWIADFRDPWSKLDLLEEFHLSYFAKRKHRKLEKKVLENANIVLTVSEKWAEEFKSLGAKRVKLITNGYDQKDFVFKQKKNDKFIIGHYGLLNHLRNPKNLWQALNILCDEYSDFNSKLEIHLAGNIDEEVIAEVESFSNLKGKLKQLGYLSHEQVLNHYNEASILLLLLFNSNSGVGNYPGKLFEYLAAKKPILAFGPQDSDVERLLLRLSAGTYLSYEVKDIKDKILRLFTNPNIDYKDSDIENYSRENLTRELAVLLNQLN